MPSAEVRLLIVSMRTIMLQAPALMTPTSSQLDEVDQLIVRILVAGSTTLPSGCADCGLFVKGS